MSEFEKNVTFVIVTYRSASIIEKCLIKINTNIKVIIIENSNDFFIKKYLEKKFSNVEVFISGKNIGYGHGNNIGISKVKTKYAFILNPDTFLQEDTLNRLENITNNLKGNFSIISPAIINNHNLNINNFENKDLIEVDYVKGFAMLLNLEKINFIQIFDQNYFLFLEEVDLCKRVKDSGGKIFIANEARVYHSSKQSSGDTLDIELCRNWHWMWSLYYFNLKHYGSFIAYKITLYKFFSSVCKILLYLLIFKKKLFLIHMFRLKGLINAYRGKTSYLRPDKLLKNL